MGPGLLIASPYMRDPNFRRTVVLICQHDEDGAIGVIVNRETAIELSELLQLLGMESGRRDGDYVLEGGPVERDAGFVLFPGVVSEESGWNLPAGVAVSVTPEPLQALIDDPEATWRFCLGYAGWAPGQLEREIETGSWLYTDIDRELIFQLPIDERYDQALATLGLTTSQVWMTPIDE